MNNKSERTKLWRSNTKKRIVESFGGECAICGYNKHTISLALHHLNPEEKEFGLGAVRANPKSWNKIVNELRKCVMVCNNCHGEIHAGVTEIPEDVKRFDESFSTYSLTKDNKDECPVCGKCKPKWFTTCSQSCANKRRQKINWESINLEKEIKIKSLSQIGRDLGCSDNAVRKRAKKLKLI